MKIKYLIICLMAVVFASCQNFLVDEPTTQLTVEQTYNNDRTADGALNGCYASLATYDYYSYRFYYVTETTSGLFATTRANTADITLGSIEVATNDNQNEKVFAAIYSSIGCANEILYYLSLPDNKLTPAVRSRIKGEAAFIRALNYFNLVRMYGRTSLITKPVTNYAETQVPRSPVPDVYNQIIADLDSAYLWLPEKGAQPVGRPHRHAAMAMLAKVYLTMATCNEITSPDKTTYWDSAYVKGRKVVYNDDLSQRNAYTLVPAYSKLFGATNKNTSESIFELQQSILAGGNRLTEVTLPQGINLLPNQTNSSQRGKTRPNKEVYDLIANTYPNDPRKDVSFVYNTFTTTANATVKCYPTVTVGTSTNINQGRDTEYPFLKKFVDPNFTTTSGCNTLIYRYADLLLVLAEAANEIGKTTEAVNYVNMVLMRARDANGDGIIASTETSPAYWPTSISQTDFRSKIMDERIIELMGEGEDFFTTHRRADYFKKVIDRHNAKLNSVTIPAGFDRTTYLNSRYIYFYPDTDPKLTRNLLLPYPLTEINNNQSISQGDQNFGY